MTTRQHSAGATPVVASATLAQSYPFGPWWAQYRVPRPGMNGMIDPRALGIVFEGEGGDAGANPPAAGSSGDGGTSGGTTEGGKAKSATDDEPLGEPGKRALERERTARQEAEDRAKAAEKERDDLKLANASEAEKAIAAAREEGKAEVVAQLHEVVRRTAVREALITAGAPASLVADLSRADEFSALKVRADNSIDAKDLEAAVAKHKERVPDAYRAAGGSGSAEGGARGGDRAPAKTLEEATIAYYEDQRHQTRA